MKRKALITGVSGQDGAYLSKLLLENGYEVYGAYRRSASLNLWRLNELGITSDIKFVPLDLLEFSNILGVIDKIKPDEIYNLAAQSFVGVSFDQPIYTSEVDGLGVTRLLEAIRVVNPKIRFYQASSSEMFGKVREVPQKETTAFHPRSPYGVAKVYGHSMAVNYRESHGMHISSGILFNHESPFRGMEFVTRKVTSSLARIRYKQQDVLELGNMDVKRDWGFAGDYVEGMWKMLQSESADDYVLATGLAYSIKDFFDLAAKYADFNVAWQGEGMGLSAIDKKSGKVVMRINPEYYRPCEVDFLQGDASKAKQKLSWAPKVNFEELVRLMVEADLRRASNGLLTN